MNIGHKIKELRLQLDMSVEELANKLGKNRATIYRYERGDIENLPLEILDPLAEALETTPAHLMGWDETSAENINRNTNGVVMAGDLIKIFRTRQKMSTSEFSKELGISKDELIKYEKGQKEIPIEIFTILGNYYSHATGFRSERLRVWAEEFKNIVFTDEEHIKIMEYSKFLLYMREEK